MSSRPSSPLTGSLRRAADAARNQVGQVKDQVQQFRADRAGQTDAAAALAPIEGLGMFAESLDMLEARHLGRRAHSISALDCQTVERMVGRSTHTPIHVS